MIIIKKILKNFEPLNTVKKGIIQNQSTFYSVIKIIISENIPKEEDNYFEIREKQTFSFDLKANEFLWVSSEQNNVKYSIVNFQSSGNTSGNSDGVIGKDGLSAYEIALNNGFVGTEEEWLESLKSSYISMDGDNKRAFLNDVFTEDELERTYTNMGKNKVMLAINRKGSNFPVKDIIPTFKELVYGVEQIQQENKITYIYDEELEKLKEHFGDIIDFEAPYKELHIYAKINKIAYLNGSTSDYATMYLTSSEGHNTNSKSEFRVYGLNNELVYESLNSFSSFSLNKKNLTGEGFKYNDEEYFKLVFKFVPIEGVDEDIWYSKHYFSSSSTDRDFLSLIAINGYQYYSDIGLSPDTSSQSDAGHNSLKFMKIKDIVAPTTYLKLENLRYKKVINEKFSHYECLNFLNPTDFSTNFLYSNSLEGTSSGKNINHGIKNIIFPWALCWNSFNSSSRTIINILDKAYFLSKKTITHFIDQIDPDAFTKSTEIRLRYSEFLNSNDPDAEIYINKMTEINSKNSLIKFVI